MGAVGVAAGGALEQAVMKATARKLKGRATDFKAEAKTDAKLGCAIVFLPK